MRPILCLACCCAPLFAESVHERLHADLAALVAARDAVIATLNERLADDAAAGAMVDFKLEAREMYRHEPLTFEIYQRGERFYGGPAQLKSWNHGDHRVDASELRREGDLITGTLTVTYMPDQWVPADRQPRHQTHEIHLRIADDAAEGWYRYEGHLGPDKDVLAGKVLPVAGEVAVDAPSGDDAGGADLAGAIATAKACTAAYRQLRAAALALRDYPASFERCLERNRTSPPYWHAEGEHATTAEDLAAYTARLAANAAAYDPARAGHEEYPRGFTHPEDPRFGPFFQNTPLPVGDDGIAALPEETGGAGAQRWQYVEDWMVTGPFPAPHRADHIEPQLPEWIPSAKSFYHLVTADFPDERFVHQDWLDAEGRRNAFNSYQADNWFKTFERPESAETYAVERSVRTGRWQDSLCPPRWRSIATKVPVWGVTRSCYFAHAKLRAPRDVTVWMESRVEDAGQLWVDDELVWHSLPNLQDIKRPNYAVFPVELKEGVNDLVYRVRNDDAQSMFRLLICTRGRPADAEGLAAREGAGRAVDDAVHTRFRGNPEGDGGFPAAPEGTRPPLAWDIEAGTNVRWRVEMPSYSCAYPFIVGDRIYTSIEPHWLACYDKMTGEELWKVASSVTEFMSEEERGPAEEALEIVGRHFSRIEDEETDRLREERKGVEMRLRDEGESMSEEEKAELERRSEELLALIDERTGKRHPGFRILKEYGASVGGWHDFTGFTMPTPACDGERIWLKYSTGVVACYDLDGERQWLVDSRLRGDIPSVSSPIVVGDVLLVEGGWRQIAKDKGIDKERVAEMAGADAGQDLHYLVALDKNTGEKLWDAPVKCGIGGYGSPGGPRGMMLEVDGEEVGVVVTQRHVFRAADGVELHRATGASPAYSGYVEGNVIVHGGSRTMLWLESPDQLGVRPLVRSGIGNAGGVVRSGDLLFANPDPNLSAGRAHVPWMDLVCHEAETGQRVYRVHPAMEGTGATYAPPSACGKYIYLVDGHGNALDKPGVKGRVLVVEAGRYPKTLARSDLDSVTYTAPIFDGDRAYIRTRRSLICLQTTTEEGRELEYAKSVEELFASRAQLPLPPQHRKVIDIPHDPDYAPGEGVPVHKLYERFGPPSYLVAGPFAPAKKFVDHLANHGGCHGARPAAGTEVGERIFAPIDPGFVETQRGISKTLHGKKVFNYQSRIDLTAMTEGEGNAVFYFHCAIEVTRPRVVEFQNSGKGHRAWLGGQEISDDQELRLGIGRYPFTLRIELGRLPPFAKDKKIVASPSFTDRGDPREELRRWQDQVRPYETRIREVLEKMPDSKMAFKAEVYLTKLAEDTGDGE